MYVHHVGGRGGTISFPEIKYFNADIQNVIYDADESCLPEIERLRKTPYKVLPYCLAEKKHQAKFYLNHCPFTSSIFPFNDDFGNYYEEKRLNYSDYLFKESFAPQEEIVLATETIDDLFEDKKIPKVDFLSIDTQGAELLILKGGAEMLARSTIAVYCEVNFVDLYRDAPLFGDLDSFMRENGFMLAGLWPMNFGYRRIPRDFRGLGVPLQGEALYLMKPEKIRNKNSQDRQLRLEKLAFCALAFGCTELAHEAVKLSLSINVLDSSRIQKFLRLFYQEIEMSPGLPPLWHESPEIKSNTNTSSNGKEGAVGKNLAFIRLINRFNADPKLFWIDLKRFFSNHLIQTLIFLNLSKLAFNKFEVFLSRYGFDRAAKEVFIRRIR